MPDVSDDLIEVCDIKTVFFFDGDAGCDLCQANTGFGLEPPKRPHEYCDCPIAEYEVEDLTEEELAALTEVGAGEPGAESPGAPSDGLANEPSDPGEVLITGPGDFELVDASDSDFVREVEMAPTCEVVILDLDIDQFDVRSTFQDDINNCGKSATTNTFTEGANIYNTLPSDLEAAARAANWAPTTPGTMSVTLPVLENMHMEYSLMVTTNISLISGERWLICQKADGQVVSKTFIGPVSGQYEIDWNLHGTISTRTRPCR